MTRIIYKLLKITYLSHSPNFTKFKKIYFRILGQFERGLLWWGGRCDYRRRRGGLLLGNLHWSLDQRRAVANGDISIVEVTTEAENIISLT